MLRIVTISTRNFLPQTRRLLRSLEASHGNIRLTVYCDDAKEFESLAGPRCSIVELESIGEIGVKRARFDLYRRAIADGDFLYLDSDIVVLESLSALTGFDSIAACADDLSGCPFIEDRRHPWPGDLALENNVYVNSGVLFIPASAASFIDLLWRKSREDDLWSRYIIDGKLHDNHFLCAYLNLESPPLRFVDELEFNWQGFYKDGALAVERRGNSLVNPKTGKKLRLVHFAGIRNIDSFLCSLPANVSSLVISRGGDHPDSWQTALTGVAGSLSGPLGKPLPDPFVLRVFDHLLAEVRVLAESSFDRDYSNEPSYFHAPETIRSLVHSRPNSTALWNDLQCGGAYLEGDEYSYLAALARSIRARSVVEVGAGETSILFRRMGISALSIEPEPGPWFDRAARNGCSCAVVPFDRATLMFDPPALDRALSTFPREVDLLFIDSPGGTVNRSRILFQFLERVRARYILFHDAHRDAANLFRYARDLNLRVVGYQASVRGFVLLAAADSEAPVMSTRPADAVPSCDIELEILDAPSRVACSEEFVVRLRISSRSDLPLSSRYLHPIFAAYHWFNSGGRCLVFDGVRTPLPFDLHPGDSATFDVRIVAPEIEASTQGTLFVTLVQEGLHWFDDKNPEAGSRRTVELGLARAPQATEPCRPPRVQNIDKHAGLPRLVRLCYEAVLNRAPSEDEVRASLHALGTDTGVDWLRGLLRSDEFSQSYLAAAGIITGDIRRDAAFLDVYAKCQQYTITSMERVYAFYQAVGHVVAQALPGDIAECGVWRGGSSMAAAYTLLSHDDTSRKIYLYDTFAGMVQPGIEDVRFDGALAEPIWRAAKGTPGGSSWWDCSLEDVRRNLLGTGYPSENLVFVRGKVEETLPQVVPDQIAILRLDTDWYESTLAELRYLYPRLVSGGILLIDDYGWWAGSRRAVDEYFAENGITMLLSRIDGCGARMGIKP